MIDLIIIGSGPAGAYAAKTATEAGLSVLFLDKKKFPRNKQCGGGLTARVTNIIPESEIEKLEGVRKNHGMCIISPSKKYVVKHYREGNSGYFVSRLHFDNYLNQEAIKAGATFKQEKVISTEYIDGGVKVKTKENEYQARLLIIANGFYSRFPSEFGLPKMKNKKFIGYSLNSETILSKEKVIEYFGEKALTTIFLGIARNGYGYVFTMQDRVNIGVGGTLKYIKDVKQIYDDFIVLLKEFYGIKDDLVLDEPKGYQSPFYRPMKKAYTDRVMVVGDAAWMVNALTGEGTYYALLSGKLAAETAVKAIKKNDTSAKFLKQYNDAWTKEFGRDLSKYAFPIKKMFFNSDRRMELAVKMAKYDDKMMEILTQTIVNVIPCKEGYRKLVKRGPIAFLKSLFGKKDK